jgi:group II intron reverse transcriptase/maturase
MWSSKRESWEPKETRGTKTELRDCLRVRATPTYGNRGPVRGARKYSYTGVEKGSGIRPTMKDTTLHDLPNKFVKLMEICRRRPSEFKISEIYSLMSNYRLYEIAYHKLKSNPGNMTPGMDQTTLDGTSRETFVEIIASMKNESFQFKPGRRVNVPKPKGGTRPLTIAPPRDKIVQEVMRMILEVIYEPTFSENSHGFRPNRSCHTALRQVKTQFGAASFYIEGDISQCFPSIDHSLLIDILKRRISDERFLHLINKALKAGYFEFHRYNHSIVGTPQGSIISPILSNIYMHILDAFMEDKKKEFDRGKEAHRNPEYRRLENRREAAKRVGDMKEANKMLKQMQTTKARLPNDPSFRRLYYVRYADD